MSTAVLANLVVYAYTSFVSPWGPGPEITKKFTDRCHCNVTLVDVGDAGSLLSRLKLEGKSTKADVVIGVDSAHLWHLRKDEFWKSGRVAPFDHAPLAFVYNSTIVKNPPRSLDDLLDPQWKGQIAIEDPRLSTVALGFLIWVVDEKGETAAWEYFKKLKPQLKLVTPSWDLAYGLFKKNQVKLVLSYWTSPAYHIQEEHKKEYKAAAFVKGQYEQTEYAVLNPKSSHLASQFFDFLLSKEAQALMPKKNFMYPANKKAPLTAAFKSLPRAKSRPPVSDKVLEKNLDGWLQSWRQIFSQ